MDPSQEPTMDDEGLFERNKRYAKETLGLREWLYYSSGSDSEQTLKSNERAFDNLALVPKILPDVDQARLNLRTKLLGKEVDMPIGICPTAYHEVMHPDAELATARAAHTLNTCFIQSFYSNKSVEEVSRELPGAMRWLNIRSIKEKELLAELIQRAERCGYSALVVSVDSAKFGNKLSAKRIPFKLPPHMKPGNLPLSPPDAKEEERVIHPAVVTWEEIQWIKSISHLPIILKGILTAEDARLAIEHGIAAIQVSNHGGRALDCWPATIEALVEISQAVGGKIDIFLNEGVRCGADVLKALALVAKAVFLGRPVLFGLHYNGCDGVVEVLKSMREQLIVAMRYSGCTEVNQISKEMVKRSVASHM